MDFAPICIVCNSVMLTNKRLCEACGHEYCSRACRDAHKKMHGQACSKFAGAGIEGQVIRGKNRFLMHFHSTNDIIHAAAYYWFLQDKRMIITYYPAADNMTYFIQVAPLGDQQEGYLSYEFTQKDSKYILTQYIALNPAEEIYERLSGYFVKQTVYSLILRCDMWAFSNGQQIIASGLLV